MSLSLLSSLLNDHTDIICRQINVFRLYQQVRECLVSPGELIADYEFSTEDLPEFPNQLPRPKPAAPLTFSYPRGSNPNQKSIRRRGVFQLYRLCGPRVPPCCRTNITDDASGRVDNEGLDKERLIRARTKFSFVVERIAIVVRTCPPACISLHSDVPE